MRVLFTNRGDGIGHSLIIAGDIGVKALADLKGKRIAWVRGSPALQLNATAVLAFANLTWDDVVRVDVPGYRQGLDTVFNNSVDATWASTTASHVQRIAASPRGIIWPSFASDDEEAWKRLWQYAPHFGKTMAKLGVGLEYNTFGKVPFPGLGTPYPAHISYDFLPSDAAYALTKAVMEHHHDFENAAPAMESYAPERQNFQMVLPYHEGAIRYFRDKGLWQEADEAHNQRLLLRQQLLATTWQQVKQLDLDDDELTNAWLKLRQERLIEAGFDIGMPVGGQRPGN